MNVLQATVDTEGNLQPERNGVIREFTAEELKDTSYKSLITYLINSQKKSHYSMIISKTFNI